MGTIWRSATTAGSRSSASGRGVEKQRLRSRCGTDRIEHSDVVQHRAKCGDRHPEPGRLWPSRLARRATHRCPRAPPRACRARHHSSVWSEEGALRVLEVAAAQRGARQPTTVETRRWRTAGRSADPRHERALPSLAQRKQTTRAVVAVQGVGAGSRASRRARAETRCVRTPARVAAAALAQPTALPASRENSTRGRRRRQRAHVAGARENRLEVGIRCELARGHRSTDRRWLSRVICVSARA